MKNHAAKCVHGTTRHAPPAIRIAGDLELTRRGFVQLLGAGLLFTVSAPVVVAQRRGGRSGPRTRSVSARIHLAKDGTITVLTGKVEMGQGARAELAQAAAEELRVPVSRIAMLMGDTSLVPDDGITAGSRTTPSTVPAVRPFQPESAVYVERPRCGLILPGMAAQKLVGVVGYRPERQEQKLRSWLEGLRK